MIYLFLTFIVNFVFSLILKILALGVYLKFTTVYLNSIQILFTPKSFN